MNSKEDELSELQEQLERYQSLLQITSPSSAPTGPSREAAQIKQLYVLATGNTEYPLVLKQSQLSVCCFLQGIRRTLKALP